MWSYPFMLIVGGKARAMDRTLVPYIYKTVEYSYSGDKISTNVINIKHYLPDPFP